MKKLIPIVTLCIILCACGNTPTEPEKSLPAKSYFPVAEYVLGEIKIIDSLPVGIMKKNINGGRRDSAFIQLSEFHLLAKRLTGEELSKAELEKNYTEHSFMDETTGYFTLNYEPLKADAPFDRIDVLVKPGQSGDKVRSIYLERRYAEHDTSIDERLFWKANISFSITREKKYKEGKPIIEQIQIIWDPSSY